MVQNELLRNWLRFDIGDYAQQVLAELPMESLTVRESTLLAGLRHLSQLKHVHCAAPLDDLTDAFPGQLRSLTLDLHRPIDLAALTTLPLEYLSLGSVSGGQQPDVDLAPLSDMPRLTEFGANWVRVHNLAALRQTTVRSLQLIDAISGPELVAAPTGWPLEDLTLVGIRQLHDLRPLRFAAGLRRLSVRDCHDLSALTGWEAWADSLKQLTVLGCRTLRLESLPQFDFLEKLDLGAAQVFGLSKLAKLSTLQVFAVGGLAEPQSLTWIHQVPQLRSLTIRAPGRVDLDELAGRENLLIRVGPHTQVVGHERLGAGSSVQITTHP